MYLLTGATQSAILNYLTMFFQESAHFDKFQIGVLQTLPCICFLLAPPLFGAIGDKLNSHVAVLYFCQIFGALGMFSLQFIRGFYMMCFMTIVANVLTAPTGPLMDRQAMNWLSKTGGDYGRQRLFAAIGYGGAAYIVGNMV